MQSTLITLQLFFYRQRPASHDMCRISGFAKRVHGFQSAICRVIKDTHPVNERIDLTGLVSGRPLHRFQRFARTPLLSKIEKMLRN